MSDFDPELLAEATMEQVALANRFIGFKCTLGSTLVVPLRVLWQAFKDWTPNASAAGLRCALEMLPAVAVVERPKARGRLKTVVLGLGISDGAS